MAGNASNADDDDVPNLDDGEGENESTVAMEAPSFDRAGIPFPFSKPPPKPVEAPPPAAGTPATAAPAATPATAPAPTPAATPAASPAKPSGAAARPAFAAAPPKAAGGAAAKPGKQTVIGLAPPAPRPAGMPSSPRVPVAVPKPGTAAGGRDTSDADPAAKRAPAPGTASASASPRSAFAATYPSQYSPGAGAGPGPGAAPAPSGGAPGTSSSTGRPEQSDAATVSVPKDVLDRVRANPKAVLAESEKKIPKLGGDDDEEGYEETKLAGAAPAPAPAADEAPRKVHADDEEDSEETRAVPREELIRQQDAHVVVGADASGDDATLAVPPSANEAALLSNIGAAIGETLQNPPPAGYPPPHGGHPHQQPHMGMGGTMGMPPASAWSSNHMPAAPRMQGGSPSYGGGPMMGHGPQGGIPRGPGPTNWSPLQGPVSPRRISGQMILLFVVGFVCLAIFVTGIVLFATTKF